jgi:hypothetical protein
MSTKPREAFVYGLSTKSLDELEKEPVELLRTEEVHPGDSERGDFGLTIAVFALTAGLVIALHKMAKDQSTETDMKVSLTPLLSIHLRFKKSASHSSVIEAVEKAGILSEADLKALKQKLG